MRQGPVTRKRKLKKSADEDVKGAIGWTWACVATVDSRGRIIWIVDAHRGDGKRFVACAQEKLTAFLELESAIRVGGEHFSLRGPVLFRQFWFSNERSRNVSLHLSGDTLHFLLDSLTRFFQTRRR
jgi:hypothetical protein